MTVKQLIAELAKYPEYTEVFLAERKTEFAYGMLNGVKMQDIRMLENPDDEEHLAIIPAIILDEE